MIAKLQPRPCKSESQEEGDKFPGKRHGGTKPVKHGSQERMWVGTEGGPGLSRETWMPRAVFARGGKGHL